MMAKIHVLRSLLFVIITIGFASSDNATPNPTTPSCGVNERYEDCGCERHCFNKKNHTCQDCKSGCYCAPGYVRKTNSSCVSEKDCDVAECVSLFEAFKEEGCYVTCRNYLYYEKGSCFSSGPGCYCTKGYVRDDYYHCIPFKDCPHDIIASPDECSIQYTGNIIRENYVGCERTCEDPHGRNCHNWIPGCYCHEGFVRLNTRCHPKSKCETRNCSVDATSHLRTCENGCIDIHGRNVRCASQCYAGSFCDDGLTRIDGNSKAFHPNNIAQMA